MRIDRCLPDTFRSRLGHQFVPRSHISEVRIQPTNLNLSNSAHSCECRLVIGSHNPELVRWHLSHGADPNLYIGEDPGSHHTAEYDTLALAAATNTLSMVQCLIEYGAKINGTKALLIAAGNPKKTPETIKIIRYLVDIGVDVNNVEGARGYWYHECWFRGTALHHAVGIEDEERVMLLLELGADPRIRGTAGFTLLEAARLAASESGMLNPMIKLLQEHQESHSPGRSLLGTL